MKQALTVGLEVKLERTHDLSAVIHVERLGDGRLMITALPLLYGQYMVTRGPGTFTLEPPLDLNLEAGCRYLSSRFESKPKLVSLVIDNKRQPAPANLQSRSRASVTPPPAENELVRVEQAVAVQPPAAAPKLDKHGKPIPAPKGGKLAKGQKAAPTPTAAPVASPR